MATLLARSSIDPPNERGIGSCISVEYLMQQPTIFASQNLRFSNSSLTKALRCRFVFARFFETGASEPVRFNGVLRFNGVRFIPRL